MSLDVPEPVHAVHLFPIERKALLDLLRAIPGAGWSLPTSGTTRGVRRTAVRRAAVRRAAVRRAAVRRAAVRHTTIQARIGRRTVAIVHEVHDVDR